jgi:hypothetical protein
MNSKGDRRLSIERHRLGFITKYKALLFLVLSGLLAPMTHPTVVSAEMLDHDSLVADVRQLADMIESIHPDPYLNVGGKVAFHRRFQSVLGAIPAQGMTQSDFYRLIRPFVTMIGDAHTSLAVPYDENPAQPTALPLIFGIVGTDFYVRAVPDEKYRPLLGALLVSVEDVPVKELLARARLMISAENEYQILNNMAFGGYFYFASLLSDLVPEWVERSRVRIVLRDKDGHEAEHAIPVPSQPPGKWISSGSRIKRPRPYPQGFTHTFLDSARTSALLVVDDMQSYREMFEGWVASNPAGGENAAREVYKRIHQSDAPEALEAVLAGIPAATDTFRTLVQEMRQAGTKTLLVDLRYNDGGNSEMYNFLLYFLYGRDVLLRAKLQDTEVRRYSRYDSETQSPEALERVNRGRAVPLTATDYDFSADWYYRSQRNPFAIDSLKAEFRQEMDQMPTFAAEYRSGKYEAYYCPANVMVLCSPLTFSSGYTLMYYLYRAGAKIVGTPSAQAGNCFGETTEFTLQHSQLTGRISHKYFVFFHDDPEMGRVLRPHYPMTYDKLKSYDFDVNAEIIYALDVCR